MERKMDTPTYYTHYVSSSGKILTSDKYAEDYLTYWMAPIGTMPKPKVNIEFPPKKMKEIERKKDTHYKEEVEKN